MAKQGIDARKAAAELLHAVLYDHRLLSEVLDRRDGPLTNLTPPDRARAQSLATTSLRHLGRIDYVLSQFLQKKPPLAVHNILRLCATELLIDNIAPHGAVDGAVTLVKMKKKTSYFSGLVNAVARKLAANGLEILNNLPPQKLPKKLRQHLIKTYDKDIVTQIETAHQTGALVDITLKDQSHKVEFAKKLNAHILPNGSLRLKDPGQISQLEGFKSGDWWVQDAAASLPARCFSNLHEKHVLDLCAAPGGKTLQLSAQGANVTAVDISPYRMKRVAENLHRTNLTADLITADIMTWKTDTLYDAILIDAPCSATGTIRRHPDLPFLNPELDLTKIIPFQKDMLAKAISWLKPGGELIFSTCSLFKEEGEDQADWLTQEHPSITQIRLIPSDYGLDDEVSSSNGGLRLRPDFWNDMGGMDGFFIAKFQMSLT